MVPRVPGASCPQLPRSRFELEKKNNNNPILRKYSWLPRELASACCGIVEVFVPSEKQWATGGIVAYLMAVKSEHLLPYSAQLTTLAWKQQKEYVSKQISNVILQPNDPASCWLSFKTWQTH